MKIDELRDIITTNCKEWCKGEAKRSTLSIIADAKNKEASILLTGNHKFIIASLARTMLVKKEVADMIMQAVQLYQITSNLNRFESNKNNPSS